MNLEIDLCCLCIKYLNKQYCWLHKRGDENLSYYEKVTSSFPQLDINNYTEDYKLCVQCCSTINIAYNFIHICKENVKVFAEYKLQLSSAKTRSDLIVQINNKNIQEFANIKTEENINSNSLENDALFSSEAKEESRTSNTDSNYNNIEFDNFDPQNDYNVTYDILNNKDCAVETENTLEHSENKIYEGITQSNVIIEIEENKCQSVVSELELQQSVEASLQNSTKNNSLSSCNVKKCVQANETIEIQKNKECENIVSGLELQPSVNVQNSSKNNILSSHNLKKRVYRVLCEVCGMFIRNISDFNIHIRTHDNDKNFMCEECGKRFYNSKSLLKHKKTHNTELYSCDLCNKRYKKQTSVIRHKRTHHLDIDNKPFKCTVCCRCFYEKSSLKSHLITHSGERRYPCSECGRRFRNNSVLAKHKLLHSGVKPFKCQLCSKTFTQKKTLDLHVMIHTGKKPFKCEKCKRRFRRKDHLLLHRCVHTK